MKTKYSLEIDVSDHECDAYAPQWANYGTIIAEGNTLDELYDDASVDVMDQDGGELSCRPADSGWMQDLIAEEFFNDPDRKAEHLRLEQLASKETSDEMRREHGND